MSQLNPGDKVRHVNVPSEHRREILGREPKETVGTVREIVEETIPLSDNTVEKAVIVTEGGAEKTVATDYLNNEIDAEDGGVTLQVLD